MFSAITSSNEWIHLFDFTPSEIAQLPARKYECPDCGHELYLKRGPVKVPHFAHLITCPASSESPAESAVHQDGKVILYQLAHSHDLDVRMEYHFETTQQRADLYLPAHHMVLEYQCSSVSHVEIASRQFDYLSQNIECLWILHTKHVPVQMAGFHLIRLSRFIRSCIRQHRNGMRTVLFWDAAQNSSDLLIIYDAFAHNEYLVERIPLKEMNTWMWFASPKPCHVPEHIKQQLLYTHQIKHIQHLFAYVNRDTYVYHRLARKWKVRADTFPLYIGMPLILPHTLGREVKWQLKVVNFMKSLGSFRHLSVEELTDAFLFSLPTHHLDTVENREVIRLYIQFLRSQGLPQKILKRTTKDLNYTHEWQRFQILAKPSKD